MADAETYEGRLDAMFQSYKRKTSLNALQLTDTPLTAVFQTVAALLSLVIGFTMLLSRRFDRHPYRLYALELLAYSGTCFTFRALFLNNPQAFLNIVVRPVFYLGTLFRVELKCVMLYRYTDVILYYSRFSQLYLEQMYIVFCLLLCIDLWLILTNPFKPQRMRVNIYYAIALIYTVLTLIAAVVIRHLFYPDLSKEEGENQVKIWPSRGHASNPIEYYYILINIFVYPLLFGASIYYLIRITRRLSRQGTSRTLYRRICIRYVLFIAFLIPFYLDRFALTILKLAQDENKFESNTALDLVLLAAPFLQTMTRICEPFVYITFW